MKRKPLGSTKTADIEATRSGTASRAGLFLKLSKSVTRLVHLDGGAPSSPSSPEAGDKATADGDFCPSCGLLLAAPSRPGSITGFMFQDTRCKCAPDPAFYPGNMTQKLSNLKATASENTFASSADPSDISFLNLAPNAIIGGAYRIKRLIGKGGMGEVYLAQQLSLDRECALKLIPPAQVTELGWKRFQMEARTVSKFNHVNVVQASDLGIHEGCLPFYAMEYVPGNNLSDLLAQYGPMPLAKALEIFKQVCDGLDYAHRKGVVHRDLKPANIMVTGLAAGRPGVKVLDFGLAKLTQADRHKQSLTAAGDLFGSPFYMSPEQCAGERIDNRSDIYSLGCTIFECLTGRPPFTGQFAAVVMLHHQEHDAPQLGDVESKIDFPDAMEVVMARMLRKNPVERYQTASELKADLERVERGENVKPFFLRHDSASPSPSMARPSPPLNTAKGGLSPERLALLLVPVGIAMAVSIYCFLTPSKSELDRQNLARTVLKQHNEDSLIDPRERDKETLAFSDSSTSTSSNSTSSTSTSSPWVPLSTIANIPPIPVTSTQVPTGSNTGQQGGTVIAAGSGMIGPAGHQATTTSHEFRYTQEQLPQLEIEVPANVVEAGEKVHFDGNPFFQGTTNRNGAKYSQYKFPDFPAVAQSPTQSPAQSPAFGRSVADFQRSIALQEFAAYRSNSMGDLGVSVGRVYKQFALTGEVSFPSASKRCYTPSNFSLTHPIYLRGFRRGDFTSLGLKWPTKAKIASLSSALQILGKLDIDQLTVYVSLSKEDGRSLHCLKTIKSFESVSVKDVSGYLSAMRGNSRLEKLRMDFADLTQADMDCVGELPNLTTLQIDASDNNLLMPGAQLASICRLSRLTYLYTTRLSYSEVSLQNLAKLKSLQILNFAVDSSWGPAQLTALRKALPACQIYVSRRTNKGVWRNFKV